MTDTVLYPVVYKRDHANQKVGRFCRWHGRTFPVNRDAFKWGASKCPAAPSERSHAGSEVLYLVVVDFAFNCGIFSNVQYTCCLSHDTRSISFTPSLKKRVRTEQKQIFRAANSAGIGRWPWSAATHLPTCFTTITLKRSSDKLQCSFLGARKSILFHDEIEALTMLRGTSEALQPKPVFFET